MIVPQPTCATTPHGALERSRIVFGSAVNEKPKRWPVIVSFLALREQGGCLVAVAPDHPIRRRIDVERAWERSADPVVGSGSGARGRELTVIDL